MEKDIRDFFRTERKRLNLTQEEVAAASAGVKQSTISKIEREAPYQPSVAVFVSAVLGLGMKASQFFEKFERYQAHRVGKEAPEQTAVFRETATDAHEGTATPIDGLRSVPPVRQVRADALEQIRETLRDVGRRLIDAGLPHANGPGQPPSIGQALNALGQATKETDRRRREKAARAAKPKRLGRKK